MIFSVIKSKYKYGVYTIKDLIYLVENRKLTKDEFHYITTYNYDVIKEKADSN